MAFYLSRNLNENFICLDASENINLSILCFETRTRNRKSFLMVERDKNRLILTRIPEIENSRYALKDIDSICHRSMPRMNLIWDGPTGKLVPFSYGPTWDWTRVNTSFKLETHHKLKCEAQCSGTLSPRGRQRPPWWDWQSISRSRNCQSSWKLPCDATELMS